MKPYTYIAALLMAAAFGVTESRGQRAERSEPRVQRAERSEPRVQRGERTEPRVQRGRTGSGNTALRRAKVQRSQTAAIHPSERKPPMNLHRSTRAGNGHGKEAPRKVSKPNKYSTKRYYSGHHYHRVYPRTRVRSHFHPDTRVHNYRVLYYPAYRKIVWSRAMYRDYSRWYPDYRWNYRIGHRIRTVSAFEAQYNLGDVAMVYGRVYATWYNRETDDLLLFFGGDYPFQQFTAVVPGRIARKYSWRPQKWFLGQHVTVTGLITTFDGSPEIIVKNRRQLDLY